LGRPHQSLSSFTDMPSRVVAGLGVGALSAIVPLYIGEAAPKKIRGTLLVLYQVQVISGLFLSYLINLACEHTSGPIGYRLPIALQLIWGAFLILGATLLPESPRLLLGRGDTDKARVAVAKLNDCEVDDEMTYVILKELEVAVAEENAHGKGGWLECFGWSNMSESTRPFSLSRAYTLVGAG
jgi:SP family sugar:H+ symporter-like MFS transporter